MKKIFEAIFIYCLSLLAGCAAPALYTAAGTGDIGTVKALLDQGADVNEKGGGGLLNDSNALFAASIEGHSDVAKLLLDRGGNINTSHGNMGWTALSGAAYQAHTDTVKLLIDRGADINKAIAALGKGVGTRNAIELLQEEKRERAGGRSAMANPSGGGAPPPVSSPQEAPVKKDRPKIAIWDLAGRDIKESYGQELTSILVSEISKLGKYEAYSQENVRTLAGWTGERMKLGCSDMQCLTALGQMDVAKLISGSVAKIGSRYSISLNLFDTQNSKAEKAVSKFCRSEDELIELVQTAVRELLTY